MQSTVSTKAAAGQTPANSLGGRPSDKEFAEGAGTRRPETRPRTSLMGLFKELKGEIRTFISQELALAKTEICEKIRYFARNGQR